jgi:DNA-binding NarL/FixJ family response regulator
MFTDSRELCLRREYTMSTEQFFEIVLVGKSILVREGLARILRSAKFRILKSISCANDFYPNKPILYPPLFLIVDTGNDFDTTLEQIKRFRDRYPNGCIAVVANRCSTSELVTAFRAGANGYFLSTINCDEFVRSVELVMMGEAIFPQAFFSFMLDSESPLLVEAAPNEKTCNTVENVALIEGTIAPLLSPHEILRRLIDGESNKCIARKVRYH